MLLIAACSSTTPEPAEHALSLVISDGVAFFSTREGRHLAVDISTGRQKWGRDANGNLHTFSTVVDGSVYYGSSDGHMYALDSETGQERWNYGTGGSMWSAPTIDGGVVFFHK